jgi:nucleoside-diphosphate-sugar epimerase
MRVLVTGSTGFLGCYVVRELARRGHDVTALARGGAALRDAATPTGVRRLRGDLRRIDEALARAIAAHDAMVHLAAVVSGTSRARFDGTVLATEQLLAALSREAWRGRLVHVSTLAVYGFNQIPRMGVVDEDSPLETDFGRRDDYAWTKTWQERLVRRWSERSDAEVVIVRPGSIYGPERAFQHRLGRLLGSRALLLIGGRTRMPLTYAENCASLIATCVDHARAADEVFNVIDPDPPPQWRYLRDLWRSRPAMVVIPVPLALYLGVTRAYDRLGRLSDGAVSAPDFFDGYLMTPSFGAFRYGTEKPREVLGWMPPVPRREALRRTFAGR